MFLSLLKNCIAYHYDIPEERDINEDALRENIAKLLHRGILPSQKISMGFSSIAGENMPELYCHKLMRFFLLSVTIEEKKINRSRFGRLVDQRKREVTAEQGIRVTDLDADQLKDIKTSVMQKLLGKTEPSEYHINMVLDPDRKRVYVDEASKNRREKALGLIAKAIPEITFTPFGEGLLDVSLTQWIRNSAAALPDEIEIAQSGVLRGEVARAALTNQDMEGQEVITLIDYDKRVTELEVIFQQRLRFRLNHEYHLKSFHPTEVYLEAIESPEEPENYVEALENHWLAQCDMFVEIFHFLDTLE